MIAIAPSYYPIVSSSPNFITNHESVCLSSVEADIVYKCVNNDVVLSPDHFIGIPTERFSTVHDECETNSDSLYQC